MYDGELRKGMIIKGFELGFFGEYEECYTGVVLNVNQDGLKASVKKYDEVTRYPSPYLTDSGLLVIFYDTYLNKWGSDGSMGYIELIGSTYEKIKVDGEEYI